MEKKLSNEQKEKIKALVDKLEKQVDENKKQANENERLKYTLLSNHKEKRDLKIELEKAELEKAKKAVTVGDIWTWATNVCKSKKKKTV